MWKRLIAATSSLELSVLGTPEGTKVPSRDPSPGTVGETFTTVDAIVGAVVPAAPVGTGTGAPVRSVPVLSATSGPAMTATTAATAARAANHRCRRSLFV